MEKITEIDTSRMDYNAFDIIMKCKELADSVDISNIILDNTSIDEKEFLIKLIAEFYPQIFSQLLFPT